MNTVRSIIHDHGNLIDRHTIMARIAISGAYKEQLKLDLKSKVKSWFELRLFDLILFYDSVARWARNKFIQFSIRTGRIQAELLKEIKDSSQQVNLN